MKLYLFIPLLAITALAVEPVMAKPSGRGHGVSPGSRGSGGASLSRGGMSSGSAYLGASRSLGGRQAASTAGRSGRSAVSSARHRHHRHHAHNHHRHHHGHYRAHRAIVPTHYPPNFPQYGYRANYNTPYYQSGGFRQPTNTPYGFPASFQPYVYNGYAATYPRHNRVFAYGTRAGFTPYTGPAVYGNYYGPYYRGPVLPNYQTFGVYGAQGPYTVPAGGVGTAAVQSRLLASGYYRGPVDGFAGPLTRAAIQRYQYQHGIPVTGRIDGHLIRSLRERSFYAGW